MTKIIVVKISGSRESLNEIPVSGIQRLQISGRCHFKILEIKAWGDRATREGISPGVNDLTGEPGSGLYDKLEMVTTRDVRPQDHLFIGPVGLQQVKDDVGALVKMPDLVLPNSVEGREIPGSQQEVDGRGEVPVAPEGRAEIFGADLAKAPIGLPVVPSLGMVQEPEHPDQLFDSRLHGLCGSFFYGFQHLAGQVPAVKALTAVVEAPADDDQVM